MELLRIVESGSTTLTDRKEKDMTIKELKKQREELARKNMREYQTRGNTQRCQELWVEIEKIDEQIAKMMKAE